MKRLSSLLLLLVACGGTEEEQMQTPTPTPNNQTQKALSSGTYGVSMTFMQEDDCAAGEAFFPTALTLDVTDGKVHVQELQLDLTRTNDKLEGERNYTQNYQDRLLECVLDFRNNIEGTVSADDQIDFEARIKIDEAPLEPDADCPFIAETELGLSTWNSLTGCTIQATFRATR